MFYLLKSKAILNAQHSLWLRRWCSKVTSRVIDFSPEVGTALETNQPVVALESTILTHGMPYPENLETAFAVESIVRDQGAVPATIGILNGRVKVGLSRAEIESLSKPTSKAVKTSRRDFPFVLSHKLNGGTTVSGTLMIASYVGIKVFVTGGVGGVHRRGESTLDISADLVEMGRQPVMVVSSGVKSILDIERTLEYLETQGVCVMSYGPSKHFPAFYCEKSGFMAPYHVTEPQEAARVLFQSTQLGVGSGILLAVPVPKPFSIDQDLMDTSINLALEEADKAGVHGKEITPFVLEKVGHITDGKSLTTNIALIKNNALIGGQVAAAYHELVGRKTRPVRCPQLDSGERSKVTVIGGSVLDCVMTLQADLMVDGRTLPGVISQTPGGVGRNIADCLGKLRSSDGPREFSTSFISAVGDDPFGMFLLKSVEHLDTSGIQVFKGKRSACYAALIDAQGEAKLGVGDMELHSSISTALLQSHADKLAKSSFLVLDGNLPEDSINYLLDLTQKHNVPVWFEPTDVLKAPKPFKTDLWKTVTCASPNMNELREMSIATGTNCEYSLALDDTDTLLKQLIYLARPIAEHIPILMITMGKLGILMVSQYTANEATLGQVGRLPSSKTHIRYYPSVPLDNITNCLGAGDCTAAGFIDGLLRGRTEPECIALGHLASQEALHSPMAIPAEFKSYDPKQHSRAIFHDISNS